MLAAAQVGLEINLMKTKWMRLSNKTDTEAQATIAVDGKMIEQVDRFVYLGQKIAFPRNPVDELRHRIQAARSSFFKSTMIAVDNSGLSLFHGCPGGSPHDDDESFECTMRNIVFGDVVKNADQVVAR
ncbi:hypothetical protein Aduo_008231 [Ancylostoma duodenale]